MGMFNTDSILLVINPDILGRFATYDWMLFLKYSVSTERISFLSKENISATKTANSYLLIKSLAP